MKKNNIENNRINVITLSDYVFGSQAIEELICRTRVCAAYDKRTNM